MVVSRNQPEHKLRLVQDDELATRALLQGVIKYQAPCSPQSIGLAVRWLMARFLARAE